MQNFTIILQSLAIVISAAGIIAGILWNIRIARRRTTFEILVKDQSDPDLLGLRSSFLRMNEDKVKELAGVETFYVSPESHPLASIMNRNDLVAIGIREATIDEKIYRGFWRDTYVRDWVRIKPAIEILRNRRSDPRICIDFENLAKKWARPGEIADIEARKAAYEATQAKS